MRILCHAKDSHAKDSNIFSTKNNSVLVIFNELLTSDIIYLNNWAQIDKAFIILLIDIRCQLTLTNNPNN